MTTCRTFYRPLFSRHIKVEKPANTPGECHRMVEGNIGGIGEWLLNNSVRTKKDHIKSLTLSTMNPHIIEMEYAVRGPLVNRALQLESELKKGVEKPFKSVIKANIGDCHATGQLPITYIRQVLALLSYTPLLKHPHFPEDVKAKAKSILDNCKGGSVGSYSNSNGLDLIREHVAQSIARRDDVPSDSQDIVLCAGASDGIKNLMKLLICDVNNKKPGVMVPIPQYPLYSATISEYGIHQVGYYLNESRNWSLDLESLEVALKDAMPKCHPRAIVVINPGNPTGQVLTRDNIESIIKFASNHNLFILADEVYQENVYAEDSKFFSFKKVLIEMGRPYNELELASFMSCSKGYTGECGLRGGYVEVLNMCPKVKEMYFKLLSANLCASVLGQAVIDCIAAPPKEGEPSYELFIKEKRKVLDKLKLKAKMVVEKFNRFEGFKCNPVQGAMYAFPEIHLPPKFIQLAKHKNQHPDAAYAFELLEKTGICVVPGSGFGQLPDTYHFRTTILPEPEIIKLMLEEFNNFHSEFMTRYK